MYFPVMSGLITCESKVNILEMFSYVSSGLVYGQTFFVGASVAADAVVLCSQGLEITHLFIQCLTSHGPLRRPADRWSHTQHIPLGEAFLFTANFSSLGGKSVNNSRLGRTAAVKLNVGA